MIGLVAQWMSIDNSGAEAATGGALHKKVLLKISQNSQVNTCVGVSFLITLQASGLQYYQTRDSDTGVFL